MSLGLIILDAQPPLSIDNSREPGSLLLLPLGYGTLLSALLERLARLHADSITVFGSATREITADGVRVAGRERLRDCVSEAEPSDEFVLIDARLIACDDYATLGSILRRASHDRARHLLARAPRGQVAAEFVQLARNGTVDRIRRYYDGVTRAGERSVMASAVSAAVLQACPMCQFSTLAEFRLSLAARGIASEDIESDSPAFDVTTVEGYLELHERETQRSARRCPPPGFRRMAADVVVAEDALIDPGAHLIGPVIVQGGARIEPRACVIGPAVLGRASRIEQDAVVAQSVLAMGSRVHAGRTVRQHLWYTTEPVASVVEQPRTRIPRRIQPDWTERPRPRRSWFLTLKRGLDVILSGFGLLLFSPVFALIAVAIRATSRGPALFAHEREGRGGRRFQCWKFRTMRADAHSQQRALYAKNAVDGPQFKLDCDPRVTVVGAWLRRTNLDELPQLINVLIGDMSLIGPRPSPFRENQICVPWRQARLSIRPGITGLWQLCRTRRAESDFHQWIYFDLLYARHLSWMLDAKILLATVLTMGGRWSVPVHWLIPSRKLHEPMRDAIGRQGLPLRARLGFGKPAA